MSQTPIAYASSPPYPPSNRPTALSVLAIIGIVFGALGVLCLGFSELFGLLALMNPGVARGLQAQPMDQRVGNLILGFGGLILSAVLLFGSIGSLNLKPIARRVMIGWAVVDILFDLLRLLIALFILLPRVSQNPVFHQTPNGQQIVVFARVGGAIGALLSWLVSTVFASLVILFFRKPDIVAAFEKTPPNPNPYASQPIPPM